MAGKRTKKSSRLYMSNAQLLAEYYIWQETGEITDEFGRLMQLLCVKMLGKHNFVGYTKSWQDIMLVNGITRLVEAVPKINLKKSENIFAYLSQILYNVYIGVLNRENLECEKIKELEAELPDDTRKYLNSDY